MERADRECRSRRNASVSKRWDVPAPRARKQRRQLNREAASTERFFDSYGQFFPAAKALLAARRWLREYPSIARGQKHAHKHSAKHPRRAAPSGPANALRGLARPPRAQSGCDTRALQTRKMRSRAL